ncbi:hypothetical protein [Tenacibaculum maritimum]|uniref:hypothetical protein n=1 Tax=Tenacibaculum maritimum TaxID=107401 RepID=UPI0012E53BF4|nr:hypothetical protein [Tenacibaculum maritimum]CAA0254495.1 hypothetical protein TMP445_80035 [Tenacibaculum maritimum]
MKYLENSTKVHLMTWETNPRKRNINNEVTIIASDEIDVNTGDVIFITPINEKASSYEVLKVTQKRNAALSNHKHYTITTKWGYISTVDIVKAPKKNNK